MDAPAEMGKQGLSEEATREKEKLRPSRVAAGLPNRRDGVVSHLSVVRGGGSSSSSSREDQNPFFPIFAQPPPAAPAGCAHKTFLRPLVLSADNNLGATFTPSRFFQADGLQVSLRQGAQNKRTQKGCRSPEPKVLYVYALLFPRHFLLHFATAQLSVSGSAGQP